VVFLDCKVPKRDSEGKEIEGEYEIKRKPIFNSKIHAGILLDIVDEYVLIAENIVIPEVAGKDKDLSTKLLHYLKGDPAKKGRDEHVVLRAATSWPVYASKWDYGTETWGPVAILELKPSIKDAMKACAEEFEAADPFSSPNDGIAVIITKNKDAKKPADFYKAKLETKKNGMTLTWVPTPLTDQQIEEWLPLKPLYKKYVNAFKVSDFYLQLDGLARFDQEMQ
jgi:hypothetical protein